jgi:hypothetical protein
LGVGVKAHIALGILVRVTDLRPPIPIFELHDGRLLRVAGSVIRVFFDPRLISGFVGVN